MDTIRKLVILGVGILLAILLGPSLVYAVLPSWGFDHAIEGGRLQWRPASGVLIERQVGERLWEQFIVDWVGPGTIQVVEYVAGGGNDLLPDDGVARQRVGTKEMRVTLNIARLYTLAPAPDEFPVVIRQKYEADIEKGTFAQGGKHIQTPQGDVYFAEYGAVQLERPARWGFRTLPAGSKVYLHDGRWTLDPSTQSNFQAGLVAGQYAGFVVFKGCHLAHPMGLEDRIEAVKSAMLSSAAAGGEAETIVFDREPPGELAGILPRVLHAGNWTVPLPQEMDVVRSIPRERRDALAVSNAISAGWGYSFPMEAMPAAESMWFLRNLQQTEIAVPYSPPFGV